MGLHRCGAPFFTRKGKCVQTKSNVTKLCYDAAKMVYILNPKQAALYLKNNAVLYDLFENRGSLVFVFDRNETTELYRAWCDHRLF